jgi:hypothetical protein
VGFRDPHEHADHPFAQSSGPHDDPAQHAYRRIRALPITKRRELLLQVRNLGNVGSNAVG